MVGHSDLNRLDDFIFFFGGGRGAMYGFHFTGATANGVPFAELTHPAAVSLLGSFSG